MLGCIWPKIIRAPGRSDYRGADDQGATALKFGTKTNIWLAKNLRTIQRTPFATLPWSRYCPETLTVPQPSRKFPAIYQAGRFIHTRHFSLSHAK